jgi:hypothetical protein
MRRHAANDAGNNRSDYGVHDQVQVLSQEKDT